MFPAISRLDFSFDAGPIAAEARQFRPHEWVRHFNRAIYEGDWSGVALRSLGGRTDNIYPDAAGEDQWRDTRYLAMCPATAAVLARIPSEVRSARFLRLGPGASIGEHRDPDLGIEHGEARLHLPIVTDDAVGFWLDGQPVTMRVGECWYLDLNRVHAASNPTTTDRIHLVVDCVADRWLSELVEAATPT